MRFNVTEMVRREMCHDSDHLEVRSWVCEDKEQDYQMCNEFERSEFYIQIEPYTLARVRLPPTHREC